MSRIDVLNQFITDVDDALSRKTKLFSEEVLDIGEIQGLLHSGDDGVVVMTSAFSATLDFFYAIQLEKIRAWLVAQLDEEQLC